MLETWFRRVTLPSRLYLATKLSTLHITANHVTLLGLLLCSAATLAIVLDKLFLAALLFALGSLCDSIDGTLARLTKQKLKFSSFLDSSVDRLSDSMVIIALVVYFSSVQPNMLLVFLTTVLLFTSNYIPYLRAKIEQYTAITKKGFTGRVERNLLITLMLLTGWFLPLLALLVVLTVITAFQRFKEGLTL